MLAVYFPSPKIPKSWKKCNFGRPPASWPTAIIFYWGMFLSSYLLTLFFRRLISEVSGPIVTKLCHMLASGDCIFLNWVRNLGVPPPKNLAAQKRQNFGLHDLIANISGREQDIVNRKRRWKPQSLHTWLPNLVVNFGPQTEKNRTGISTYSIDIFRCSYLRG